MFNLPTYSQIKTQILNEYLSKTGVVADNDGDFAIRADGTAAVLEGLYHHQQYILRQLFPSTADEPFLYIHADELGVPRQAGTFTTGQVYALGVTSGVTVPQGTRLTDGFGNYFETVTAAVLTENEKVIIPIQAERTGSAYNQSGTLRWVSAVSGLESIAEIQTLSGGSDFEDLERWRNRVVKRKQLGKSLSRLEDLRQAVLGVAGVANAYIYPLRRGAGSIDAAITAQGADGATLPSNQLVNDAEAALIEAATFFESVKAFSPTPLLLDVTAVLTGASINLGAANSVINDYIDSLTPAEPYRESVLTALLLELTGVTDVQLTPNENITPQVDFTQVGWIRRGAISVTL